MSSSVSHATSLAWGPQIMFVETNGVDIYYVIPPQHERHESMNFVVFTIKYPIKSIVSDMS